MELVPRYVEVIEDSGIGEVEMILPDGDSLSHVTVEQVSSQ